MMVVGRMGWLRVLLLLGLGFGMAGPLARAQSSTGTQQPSAASRGPVAAAAGRPRGPRSRRCHRAARRPSGAGAGPPAIPRSTAATASRPRGCTWPRNRRRRSPSDDREIGPDRRRCGPPATGNGTRMATASSGSRGAGGSRPPGRSGWPAAGCTMPADGTGSPAPGAARGSPGVAANRPAWRTTGPPAEQPDDTPPPAPGPDFFYVPGHYAPAAAGDRLAWVPGFWAAVQLGWDWIPARWVRRPDGWDFREGHWMRDPTRPSSSSASRPGSSAAAAAMRMSP